MIRLKLKTRQSIPPTKVTTALPDASEALSKSNEGPDPLQMGMAFMRPISIPGYIIVSTDAIIPRHTTAYNARGAKPVYRIPIVRIKKMINRERLIAPKVSGDLVLKNVLGTRRIEFASIISSKTDTITRPRDENTPFKSILPPKRRQGSTDII